MSPLWAIAFSRDGRLLATGGGDHSVRVWDAATGRERRTFTGHSDRVLTVAFSGDGRCLASGSNDGIRNPFGAAFWLKCC